MIAGTVSPVNAPLVTIGITCFNAAETIERAIDSAAAQLWPQFEIVVVDDGSADESVSIVTSLARRDSRIRLITHETNRGYAGALNTIFHSARGGFVAVFDDDDESRPDRLSKQWARLNDYERATGANLVLCYANRDVVKNGHTEPPGYVFAVGRSAKEPRGEEVADFLLWHFEQPGFTWGQFGSCTLFVRTQTVLDLGGFDESFRRSAEWDLVIRAALRQAHFIAVDEPLVTQHITSTADKAGKLPLEYALKLREKYRSYLEARHVYPASKAIAHSRFHYAKGRKWASRIYLALACLLSPTRVMPNEWSKWNRRRSGSAPND